MIYTNPLTRYVQDERGCWRWTLSRNDAGYGHLTAAGVKQLAHRYFYVQLRGPIPDGHDLHHLCGVRECVNPDHLEPMMHDEHAGRKLSRDAARRVRELVAEGWLQREVAEAFGVSQPLVSMTVNRRAWASA